MRKNRLIWNIALFLAVIISLPIAHAQLANLFGGGNILLILINSAIVGVILFVLQSFLIPGKDGKEKPAVYTAIIAGSLLIGWFFGSQGFIWQNPVLAKFFSIYVLANTIIIGIALYLISGFLDINKKLGMSPEGKGGLGIIIFLIAVMFAVQIGNQFVWQKPVVQQFIDYLFGSQGILNPAPPEYRLWAFITVTLLLSFFFKGFLLKSGAGGTDKVNYALAILIGTSVARAGISFASIVLLGEAIFTIILAEALKGTAPDVKGKSTNWILAAFLVGWASAAMTYGTEYQGWLATFVGLPLWAMGLIQVGPTGAPAQPSGTGGWISWIFKLGGGAFVLLLLIPLLFYYVIGRGNNRASERSMIREGRSRGWQELKRKLRQNRASAWIMRKVFRLRNESFPDELPFDIKDMRLEIYTLMNWMLRHEVWVRKGGAVTKMKHKISEAERRLGNTKPTEGEILDGIMGHIEGAKIGPANDIWDKLGDPRNSVGWGRFYFIFVQLMNELRNDLMNTNLTTENRSTQDAKTQAGNWVTTGRGKEIIDNAWDNHIVARYNRYLSGIGRYKGLLVTRANRQLFGDMLNMYGTYKRGYLFAKPDALAEHYSYVNAIENVPAEDRSHTVKISIDLTKVEKIAEGIPNEYKEEPHGEELLELNIYGFSISDINKIEVEGINLHYIRRFRVGYIDNNRTLRNGQRNPDFGKYKSDVSELHVGAAGDARFERVLTFSEKDWEYATKDMFAGVFHPMSRRVDNYQRHFDIIHEKLSTAPFDRPLNMGEVAFDREALKISHALNYWGRKKYFDQSADGSEIRENPANPYPAISVKGLWDFIFKYSTAASGDPERTKIILNDYFKSTYEAVDTTYQEKQSGH